ncbi:MAG: inositol monophosphatase family protein [Actinomycetota bacterium]|nr:inositol monophosphatase family protein [Actinomycetota bacterium]
MPTGPAAPADALRAQLLQLASDLAVQAGRMARDGRTERGVQASATKSSATDMVTEFDKASEALIVGGILAARPGDGIVGEEGTDTVGTSGVDWLIDPIDGTTNFLYGLPGWAVSIAARTDDGTQVGVVYVPSCDELFTAAAGNGACLNGRPIRCSTTSDLPLALVATGFSYLPQRRALQARRVAAMLPQVRDVRRLGAAAPDLCNLAAGRVDVYFEQWLGPWDLAAGELIAREAGCLVGGMHGGPVHHSSVLAATPALFAPMRGLIARIDAELGPPDDPERDQAIGTKIQSEA